MMTSAYISSTRISVRYKPDGNVREGRRGSCTSVICRAQAPVRDRRKALDRLLSTIKDSNRGLDCSKSQKSEILTAVESLVEIGKNQETTSPKINATWRLLWTTEKETLFILKNAKRFGTEPGEVYQVIDTASDRLQNVITFANGASFVVDSSLQKGDKQRLVFKFTAARLNLPSRTWRIPPFGKGWFDTVYLDEKIRVARDIRGDTLVVTRDGPPKEF